MKFDKNLTSVGTSLLILNILSRMDMYGYQIIQELQRQSNSVFEFQEGTLYPVLYSLEKDQYVESYSVKADNGKTRKYYRISLDGTRLLEKKKTEWNIFSNAVDSMLKGESLA